MVTKEQITKAIQESEDLVTALEAVGAMYNIPSSNILCDDSIKSIKVVEDCIVAPPCNNTTANTKSIVCAIGACLDNISQRINDKIDMYQHQNVCSAKQNIIDSLKELTSPSKGNVVGNYLDDDGNEVIVYDTGMIDAENTPAALRKIDELSRNLQIPMYNKNAMARPTYFTEDEDDISAGLDMNVDSASEPVDLEEQSISDNINESYELTELVEKYGFTNNLGYEIFKEYYDFIKPTSSQIYQESKTPKQIKPEDIKHMKFDNKNIIKAIRCFNEARAEQPNAKKQKIDIEKLIRSPKWEEGVRALEAQFNCHLQVRFFTKEAGGEATVFTEIYNEIKNKISISKTKGFQLGNSNITIVVVADALDEDAPNDSKLFGQNVVSTFLHEIFHNIASALRYEEAQFECCLKATLAAASAIRSGRKQRALITKYVNTLDSFYGIKLNRFRKKALIKQLSVMASMQFDDRAIGKIKANIKKTKDSNSPDADKEIEELIALYENEIKKYDKLINSNERIPQVIAAASFLAPFILGGLGVNPKSLLGITSFIAGGISTLFHAGKSVVISTAKEVEEMRKEMKTDKEEYYCDLFAGMYGLPVTFFLGYNAKGSRRLLPKDIKDENLAKLAKLEKRMYEINWSVYPTSNERNHAAVKIATNLLDSGYKLDPEIKEYCEWIRDNFKSTLNTDIENDFNDKTFDPKEADDLDAHLDRLIAKADIALTESFIEWLNEDYEVIV